MAFLAGTSDGEYNLYISIYLFGARTPTAFSPEGLNVVSPSFKAEYVPCGPSFGVTGSEAFEYTGKLVDITTWLYY